MPTRNSMHICSCAVSYLGASFIINELFNIAQKLPFLTKFISSNVLYIAIDPVV